MSQRETSEISGISRGRISKIESGRVRLTIEDVVLLSKAYRISQEYVSNGERRMG